MIEPGFVKLFRTGELERRVEALERLLGACTVCPKDCGNDRLKDEIAACYSGRLPIVSSYTAHFGEEPALSGTHGAGNIFFGNCNLRCVYCQNYQISQTWKEQKRNEVTHERLAEMMLELQVKAVTISVLSHPRISLRKWPAPFSSRRKTVCGCPSYIIRMRMIRSRSYGCSKASWMFICRT
jgi:uncharacterized Fe-S radical SAM superfamily protein PflX